MLSLNCESFAANSKLVMCGFIAGKQAVPVSGILASFCVWQLICRQNAVWKFNRIIIIMKCVSSEQLFFTSLSLTLSHCRTHSHSIVSEKGWLVSFVGRLHISPFVQVTSERRKKREEIWKNICRVLVSNFC
jgi:hypothetical protein